MSEDVQAKSHLASTTNSIAKPSESDQQPQNDAIVRIDNAHTQPSLADSSHQTPCDDISASAINEMSQPSFNGLTGNEGELLLQASRIAENVRSQFSELNRRKQNLNEQLTLLDQERRNVRLWMRQLELEVQEREVQLQTRETASDERFAACEKLEAEFQEQEQVLIQSRDELTQERTRLKKNLECELDEDRSALKRLQKDVEAEQKQLCEQIERNQQEHETSLKHAQNQLKSDRIRLREELTEERFTDELRHQRDELRRDQKEWNTLRDAERTEISHERESHERQLIEHRQIFEKESDERHCELQHQSAVLENRYHFQQDHLAKTRHELGLAKKQFNLECQNTQQQFAQTETLHRLRLDQLEHYRTLLEERERSVERERELLMRSRHESEESLQADKARFVADRETWEHERQAQHTESRRQQDMLALHAENLEARRLRLDRLRAELEDTHRDTLEIRMAVEEAWAQLSQAAGGDDAKQRVEVARHALSEHYQQLQETLTRQRQELDESQGRFQQQRDEFHEERQALTNWVAERDERLRQRDKCLRDETEQLDTQEAAWRSARDRWMQEKFEAESIIRDLLKQLTELNASSNMNVNETAPNAINQPAATLSSTLAHSHNTQDLNQPASRKLDSSGN